MRHASLVTRISLLVLALHASRATLHAAATNLPPASTRALMVSSNGTIVAPLTLSQFRLSNDIAQASVTASATQNLAAAVASAQARADLGITNGQQGVSLGGSFSGDGSALTGIVAELSVTGAVVSVTAGWGITNSGTASDPVVMIADSVSNAVYAPLSVILARGNDAGGYPITNAGGTSTFWDVSARDITAQHIYGNGAGLTGLPEPMANGHVTNSLADGAHGGETDPLSLHLGGGEMSGAITFVGSSTSLDGDNLYVPGLRMVVSGTNDATWVFQPQGLPYDLHLSVPASGGRWVFREPNTPYFSGPVTAFVARVGEWYPTNGAASGTALHWDPATSNTYTAAGGGACTCSRTNVYLGDAGDYTQSIAASTSPPIYFGNEVRDYWGISTDGTNFTPPVARVTFDASCLIAGTASAKEFRMDLFKNGSLLKYGRSYNGGASGNAVPGVSVTIDNEASTNVYSFRVYHNDTTRSTYGSRAGTYCRIEWVTP